MAGHDGARALVVMSLLLILHNACVCLCRNSSSSSNCFKDERDALLQLKQSFSHTYQIFSSWNSEDCCQWAGVRCDRTNGHVIMLQITNPPEFLFEDILLTAGELNSSLLNLRYLSHLELSGILFKNANVLESVGSMKQLRYLNLSYSTGFVTFPREWGNLTGLEVLDLRGLRGLCSLWDFYYSSEVVVVVDDIRWVSHLPALKYLDMSGVNFTGSRDLMQVINKLPSLSHLSLSSCQLYEFHLPTSPRLQYLDVSKNYFGSSIPSNIFQNITSLRHLDLSWTMLNGSIASTLFQNMTSLRHLDLSWNMFNGPIPNTIFQNLTSLRYLDLSWNMFNNSIPITIFQNVTSLRYLDLSCNMFIGPIPNIIFQNMTSLWHLGLSDLFLESHFSGKSCSRCFFVGLMPSSLHYLDLSWNDIKGPTLNAIFQNMTSLTHLDLSGNLLECPIPSTIFQDMTSLQHLHLSSNNFSSLPRWLDNLKGLVDLDLGGNRLHSIEGGLFSFLKNKPFLESLSLGGNKFHEEIFSFEGNSSGLIGKNLKRLEIDHSVLEGDLPSWLMNLKKLMILDLSYNQLRGAIPSSYGGWLCLEELYLSHNQLTGNIPETLGGLPVLRYLQLDNNLLNGIIPHSLGQLQDLRYLDLSENSLRGTLSEIHFSNLSKLSYLDISNNYLALQVDFEWIPPFSLHKIGMTSCDLGGEFPQWIRTQIDAFDIVLSNASITKPLPDWLGLMSFVFLNLSHNQISGSLPKFPPELFNLDLSYNRISGSLSKFPSKLKALDLSHNRISGPLPKFHSNLNWLDLSDNSISGPIPQDIHLAMPQLFFLYLNDNRLSGRIPTSFCMMELEELHLGRNELVGKIPACWKESYMYLLDLSSNKLSGVIPSSLGNLASLSSIRLSDNNLHGEIPVTMNNCRSLVILDLGENKISGSVPHWFGQDFRFLQILRLRENLFNGSIPSQICSLFALQILDLAMNNLIGMIPNCLGNMKGMKLYKSTDKGKSSSPPYEPEPSALSLIASGPTNWNQIDVEQVVKGIDLDYTTLDLQLMVNLDLSSNKLTGPIPKELTLLSGLRGLNLSHNFFSEGIPTMIGDMKSLESLDLSHNHLSGTIPQSFSAFTSLSKLNLSHNNLTGPIPKGNQIQTLDDPSIYADNPLLCGNPLQKPCPGVKAPEAPEEDTHEESTFEKVVFYIVIMLGFAVGFWGVNGVLMYKRSWRRIYFSYVDRKADMVYVIVAVKVAEWRRRLRRA